jgi:hypothetical protein
MRSNREAEMTQILAFIVAHMEFLWVGARFRITGSEVTTVNGGNALLLVESDVIRLRFVRDRDQLFLDFQPIHAASSSEWFSVDLIRRLLLGQPEVSGLLDEGYAEFVRDRLDEIEDRFGDATWAATRDELKRLKVIRSREMFG